MKGGAGRSGTGREKAFFFKMSFCVSPSCVKRITQQMQTNAETLKQISPRKKGTGGRAGIVRI